MLLFHLSLPKMCSRFHLKWKSRRVVYFLNVFTSEWTFICCWFSSYSGAINMDQLCWSFIWRCIWERKGTRHSIWPTRTFWEAFRLESDILKILKLYIRAIPALPIFSMFKSTNNEPKIWNYNWVDSKFRKYIRLY